ncbi:hypothetical protein GWK48_10465 [Metallosphaera tengchongensis]|uniref:CRISPR-associated protein n=1 Tax=Metallosphaera tengchongensis TaxID=1532350 RepID=A0A6N0NX39_9CREN|nr:CRISPR-associated ring nuclease Crn1 [Metallosphaera tengchongensis]QKR00755.1 hypothetical protein GWK48_10465 [Metallosphaera tengchongensis]
MVNLLATLGRTVGGPVETFENLSNGNYISDFPPHKVKVDELIALTTSETEETFFIMKAVLMCCLNFTKVRAVRLDIDDVSTPQDFVLVREKVKGLLRPGDYLDFSGGRKAISSAAVLGAREVGAHLVTSIIGEDEYDRVKGRMVQIRDRALAVYRPEQCLGYLCDLYTTKARTIVFF